MSSTKIENRTENQPSSSSPNLKSPADSSEMLGQKEQTYMEWAQEKYNEQYDVWMPWIEDHFLKWFTTHNKASYATKGSSEDLTCLSTPGVSGTLTTLSLTTRTCKSAFLR